MKLNGTYSSASKVLVKELYKNIFIRENNYL